jgi:hypothetical protein
VNTVKKPEQQIRYDNQGAKATQQDIMNAYQSGVVDEALSSSTNSTINTHDENVLLDDNLEEKNPDDFE